MKTLEDFGKKYPDMPIQLLALVYDAYLEGRNDAMAEELAWLDENFKPENVTVHTNREDK